MPTRNGITVTPQLPSGSSSERAYESGDNIVVRKCALVGYSLNDKQWSSGLSNPPLYQTTCPKVGIVEKHDPKHEQGWAGRCPRLQCSAAQEPIAS